MSQITQLIDYFLHLDKYLALLANGYGVWIYLILFLVVFSETGLVIMPLLPGDSLLFAAGSLASIGVLKVHVLAISLCIAAILGDAVNYWIGHWCGPKAFRREKSFWLNPDYLLRTQAFYAQHGGKTIVLARFIPIIRTFAPFVAGIGKMTYRRFSVYNITGAIIWVCLFLYGSYWFGNIPLIRKNFSLVIMVIIIVSLIPPWVEFIRHRKINR